MKLQQSFLLPLFTSSSLARDHYDRRCTAYDSCWPSPKEWSSFNSSIGGRLIASRPSAAVCHGSEYIEALCATAKANWTSSDWRTAQPGAYSAILWELGPDQCFINSTIDSPCDQGLVAEYTVNASSIEDIQKAVKWAAKKHLYLNIKNTGHDHLGRSSGKGAFAIWTHNLKGRTWHDKFVVKQAPDQSKGVKAVTLKAGEQWLDVYRDADKQGVIVVGGSARTVGAAGGWFTGGGHSAWSHFYGLGVDNVLEVSIITASGEAKTLNPYSNPEHFWAIRGGGGNSWGIITSISYRTHPLPKHINTVFAQYATNSSISNREVHSRVFKALPAITDAGYTGYGYLGTELGLIFIQPNATNETATRVMKDLNEVGNVTNVASQVGTLEFPTWMAYSEMFLQDPNIATNVIDPSRLLTADVLANKTEELLDLLADFPDLGPGFNFIGSVSATHRHETSVHPIWSSSRALLSLGADWPDDTPESEKKRIKLRGVEASRRLAEIVGQEGGTYINEANPYEPDWEEVFWGKNYERLVEVKKKVDPKGMFRCNRCVGGDTVFEP